MSDDGDRISAPPRALRLLVEELRGETPPALDWSGAEERLLAALDREGSERPAALERRGDLEAGPEPHDREGSSSGAAEILVPWDDEPAADESWRALRRPPRLEEDTGDRRSLGPRAPARRGRLGWAAAGAAVALAAAAALVLAPRPGAPEAPPVAPVDLASVAAAPRLGDALDLASLRSGDVVEAVEGPVTFGREGLLSWTLSPGGRVRVVSGLGREGAGHVVSLESGALEVEVVPPPPERPVEGERFVVEVAEARVAVHGTAFRVVRSTRSVVVEVSRGVVAVGPRRGGAGAGHRLEAPRRAAFDLDGGSVRELPAKGAPAGEVGPAIVAQASADERYAGAQVVSPPAPALVPPPAPSVAAAPAAPPASPVWSDERVQSEVVSCIRRSGASGSEETWVTIGSRLIVDVDAAGHARSVRFDPPVRPDLHACAQPIFGASFAPGARRLVVPFEVRLGGARAPR